MLKFQILNWADKKYFGFEKISQSENSFDKKKGRNKERERMEAKQREVGAEESEVKSSTLNLFMMLEPNDPTLIPFDIERSSKCLTK